MDETKRANDLKEREVAAMERRNRLIEAEHGDYKMDSVLGCFPMRKRPPISAWERFWYGPKGR